MSKLEKATILIVDDKATNIFAIEEALNKPGRSFQRALNGTEALKTVLNKEIDLIILDVQMPGMDGFEVAQILKSNKRTSDIPIIFASAEKKEHQFVLKGLEEGAIDYLYKPLDPEIMEAKVSVLLRLYLQKKELQRKNITLEKYALLINNSADLICIINAKTLKFEEVNEAARSILGYTPEDIIDTSLLFYLSEEDRIKVQSLSKEDNPQFSFETQVYTKDRAIKWLSWDIVNKFGLWLANANDITGVKEVEEIKNYLSIVVKQSNDAIYLHNQDGKIISWNEGAEKIYGYSEEEALNMKIWNVVPDQLMPEMQTIINDIAAGKEVQSFETKRITRRGRMIDVIFSASVITDSFGTIKLVTINERDITEQKKAETEQKRLEEELKNFNKQLVRQVEEKTAEIKDIFERVSDGFIAFDKEANITYVNQKALQVMGKSLEDILNKNFWKEYPETVSSPFYMAFYDSLNEQKPISYENFDEQHNSWSDVHVYPSENGLSIYYSDISEKKKTEEALKQSHQDLRLLASHLQDVREEERAAMAREIHDVLGQQLTGLKMDVSWIATKMQGADELVKQKMQKTIELLNGTIITVRKIATELRPSILDDLGLIEAIEWQSREFENRSEIQTKFSSTIPDLHVKGSIAIALFRIYQESLTNVARHAAATRVTATLAQKEDRLILTVTDNGKGFDINSIGNKKTLGLLGMKERTSMVGGKYEIISKPGSGTTVSVTVSLGDN